MFINKMLTLENLDEFKIQTLAINLAKQLQPGDCLALFGDLGAGKTTFSRALIKALAPDIIEVPSPTFTIIQQYQTVKGEVWHCDLYRLKSPDEIIELGLEEAFSYAMCILEWPDKIAPYLPRIRLDMTLTVNCDQSRHVTICNHGLTHVDLSLLTASP